jgi:hypothetical protein
MGNLNVKNVYSIDHVYYLYIYVYICIYICIYIYAQRLGFAFCPGVAA